MDVEEEEKRVSFIHVLVLRERRSGRKVIPGLMCAHKVHFAVQIGFFSKKVNLIFFLKNWDFLFSDRYLKEINDKNSHATLTGISSDTMVPTEFLA